MLVGFDKFSEVMRNHNEQFVVIGGTACEAALEDTGIARRATRDIDMVVIIEQLSAEFIAQLWHFFQDGGYKASRRTNRSGRSVYAFYRFEHPTKDDYPAKIEILARQAEYMFGMDEARIEPIVDDEALYSLSAIIMDDDVYQFTIRHWEEYRGVRMASPTALVCLKARAYLNLLQDRAAGKHVNTEDIKKHRRDVLMLLATGKVEDTVVPMSIYQTFQDFISAMRELPLNDLAKSLGVTDVVINEYLEVLSTTFTIE